VRALSPQPPPPPPPPPPHYGNTSAWFCRHQLPFKSGAIVPRTALARERRDRESCESATLYSGSARSISRIDDRVKRSEVIDKLSVKQASSVDRFVGRLRRFSETAMMRGARALVLYASVSLREFTRIMNLLFAAAKQQAGRDSEFIRDALRIPQVFKRLKGSMSVLA
jgi:hypothetical protein